jgi:hypothetical protein
MTCQFDTSSERSEIIDVSIWHVNNFLTWQFDTSSFIDVPNVTRQEPLIFYLFRKQIFKLFIFKKTKTKFIDVPNVAGQKRADMPHLAHQEPPLGKPSASHACPIPPAPYFIIYLFFSSFPPSYEMKAWPRPGLQEIWPYLLFFFFFFFFFLSNFNYCTPPN